MLDAAETPRVVVVGSVNVDLVTKTQRLPKPGETVIGGTFEQAHGGKGANQAACASRLGAVALIVGKVGPDDFGSQAREELERCGVDVSELGTGRRHTGVAQILVDEGGENVIAVASGANRELSAGEVEAALERIGAEGDVVLANLEVPEDAVAVAASWAARSARAFVLNPAPARPLSAQLLAHCDVVTPNEHEATRLGYPSVEGLLEAGASAVVVTRGASGADLVRKDRRLHHQDAFDVEVRDTTGAGDAFSAGLAWALAGGSSVEEAVRVAAAAGALATRRVGARAALPTRAELEDLLGQ